MGKFAPGVRIFVLSDSCHSGTVLRAIGDNEVHNPVANREIAAEQSPRYRAMPWDVVVATYREHKELYDGIQEATPDSPTNEVSARVLLISGCQDDQLSSGTRASGTVAATRRSRRRSWAIVIGIDDHGDDRLRLNGAVADAGRFGEWVGSDAADLGFEG